MSVYGWENSIFRNHQKPVEIPRIEKKTSEVYGSWKSEFSKWEVKSGRIGKWIVSPTPHITTYMVRIPAYFWPKWWTPLIFFAAGSPRLCTCASAVLFFAAVRVGSLRFDCAVSIEAGADLGCEPNGSDLWVENRTCGTPIRTTDTTQGQPPSHIILNTPKKKHIHLGENDW